jgi:hypothetical protein
MEAPCLRPLKCIQYRGSPLLPLPPYRNYRSSCSQTGTFVRLTYSGTSIRRARCLQPCADFISHAMPCIPLPWMQPCTGGISTIMDRIYAMQQLWKACLPLCIICLPCCSHGQHVLAWHPPAMDSRPTSVHIHDVNMSREHQP